MGVRLQGEEDVVLRPLTGEDADDLADLTQDALVRRWALWLPPALDRAGARRWIATWAEGWWGAGPWVFAVESQGRCAGLVSLAPDGAGGAALGFSLAPWARGRGLASSAVRLALTWVFAEQGLEVVHWRGRQGDWAARRVVWAAGMTVEGTVRSGIARDGDRYDAWTASVRWEEPLRPRGPWLEAVPLVGDGPTTHLGPLVVDDVQRIAAACASPEARRWLPELPHPYTAADAISFVATREDEHVAGRGVYWAVRESPGGALAATVALFRLQPGGRSGEVGYWAHPDARGRGVMTSAVRAVVRHALTAPGDGGLGLARVALRAAEGNTGSRRVAERAGFRQVGVEREAELLRDGTVSDLVCYDLVRADLRTPAPGGAVVGGAVVGGVPGPVPGAQAAEPDAAPTG